MKCCSYLTVRVSRSWVSSLLGALLVFCQPSARGRDEPDPQPQPPIQRSANEFPMPPTASSAARADSSPQLQNAAKRIRSSLVYLGRPDGDEFHGTGFVISRTRRLVLTAAHVADGLFEEGGIPTVFGGSLFAVVEGSTKPYRIQTVYYHPGVMRELDFGLQTRSLDVADGPVSFPSPDIAVLKLADEGGDLPPECELELALNSDDTAGRIAGILGYWDISDEASWPSRDHPARASFTTTLIRPQVTKPTREDPALKRYVYGDIDHISGGSGGPVFLSDGRVIAIVCQSVSHPSPPSRSKELRASLSGL